MVLKGSSVIIADGREQPAGRGASLHPLAECLEKAVKKRGAFKRAFKVDNVEFNKEWLLSEIKRILGSG